MHDKISILWDELSEEAKKQFSLSNITPEMLFHLSVAVLNKRTADFLRIATKKPAAVTGSITARPVNLSITKGNFFFPCTVFYCRVTKRLAMNFMSLFSINRSVSLRAVATGPHAEGIVKVINRKASGRPGHAVYVEYIYDVCRQMRIGEDRAETISVAARHLEKRLLRACVEEDDETLTRDWMWNEGELQVGSSTHEKTIDRIRQSGLSCLEEIEAHLKEQQASTEDRPWSPLSDEMRPVVYPPPPAGAPVTPPWTPPPEGPASAYPAPHQAAQNAPQTLFPPQHQAPHPPQHQTPWQTPWQPPSTLPFDPQNN